MKTVALETSGTSFSLALADDETLITELFWQSGLKHSETLIPALSRLMAEAGWQPSMVEKVAVSIGPGSFTGIRVGLSCARAFAQSSGIPVVGMTTLALLRAAVPPTSHRVVPLIDALRNEVYMENKSGDARIVAVDRLKKEIRASAGSRILFVGSGAVAYRHGLAQQFGARALIAPAAFHIPRAGILAIAAQKIAGTQYDAILPLYIRRSWAEENR